MRRKVTVDVHHPELQQRDLLTLTTLVFCYRMTTDAIEARRLMGLALQPQENDSIDLQRVGLWFRFEPGSRTFHRLTHR